VEWGDLRIPVQRGVDGNRPQPAAAAAIADTATPTTEDAQQPEPATAQTAPAPAQPTSTPSTTDAQDVPEHWVAVTAPLAGTVYRAPRPDASPFVEVGDTVAPEDTVALVEVMKLFTELKAEVSGKVARIEAEDSSLVEFGQNLIWIEPA
jgi:acetyl-CoA carboxylase biotin carboxyl carrier protein